ncbi:peroxiredoxin, partial [Streptomyces cahuitamycinicus]
MAADLGPRTHRYEVEVTWTGN